MAARKPTPKAAAEKAAATPPPAAVVVDKDATDADVNAAQEQAEADAKAAEELAAKEKAQADAKAAEELAAKEKAKAAALEPLEYVVNSPVNHDGESYSVGDYIYLTAKQAERLNNNGTISPTGESA
jgi:acyl-CoA reductase-like NAD-dependent aldehyde dehydrogenase